MKKISALFIAGLITLCFSISLNAQSSDKDLDQVELMKQFIGEWKADLKNDTVINLGISPLEKGYVHTATWKTKGETVNSSYGVSGFTWKYGKINMFALWSDGMVSRDLGKFITKDKLVLERFSADHKIKFAIWELTFLTPDKIKSVYKWKGGANDWSEATITEFTFQRVVK